LLNGGNKNIKLKIPKPIDPKKYQFSMDDPHAIEAIGYGIMKKNQPLESVEFQRRTPREHDVVIKILYCGVCHSDWHSILNQWHSTTYPLVPGHEITGKVI